MDDLIKMLDGNEKGEGDLLEDFVLTATEAQVYHCQNQHVPLREFRIYIFPSIFEIKKLTSSLLGEF